MEDNNDETSNSRKTSLSSLSFRPYIAFSGLIGAGKTTLANELGRQLSLPVYHEPVDENPYLEHFYKDMGKYSFPMQVFLLEERFKQHQQIVWACEGGISDRSLYEDEIFCRTLVKTGMMSELDHQTYKNLFKIMGNSMKHPTIIVHLDVTPEESYERIMERGRECEKTITIEYLRILHREYDIFLKELSKSSPVFRIKWDNFYDSEKVASAIISQIKNTDNIHYLAISE